MAKKKLTFELQFAYTEDAFALLDDVFSDDVRGSLQATEHLRPVLRIWPEPSVTGCGTPQELRATLRRYLRLKCPELTVRPDEDSVRVFVRRSRVRRSKPIPPPLLQVETTAPAIGDYACLSCSATFNTEAELVAHLDGCEGPK